MKNIDYDFLTKLKLPGQLCASPDGNSLAFILSEAEFEDNSYKCNLWLHRERKFKQLTFDGKVTSFSWEDNDNLLFQAQRTEKEKEKADQGVKNTNFYRLNIHGGEARPAFELPFTSCSIESLGHDFFLISGQFNQTLPNAYILPEDKRKEVAKEDDDNKYFSHMTEIPFYFNGTDYNEGDRQGLFLYNARLNKIERISRESYNVSGYRLSEDRQRVYFFADQYLDRAEPTKGVFLANLPISRPLRLEDDMPIIKAQEILADGLYSISDVWEAEPEYAENSKVYVLASDMHEYGLNESNKLYQLDKENKKLILVDDESFESNTSLNSDVSFSARPSRFVKDGNFYFLATNRDHDSFYRIRRDGQKEELYAANGALLAVQAYGQNFAVWALEDMLPAELYYLGQSPEGLNKQRFSNFNAYLFEEYRLIKPVEIKSGEDPEIDGWVLYPADFVEGQEYPAILNIHGGPRTAYGPVFFHEMQIWAQKSYFVIFCNPRGSSGRGDDFADIRGKYGSIDYDDIMEFVDTCLDEIPEIDRNRMGVTGGSYGGFMSNWIITHTDRFKACATQRSISNWISFYGCSDIGYTFACDQMRTLTNDQAGFLRLWEFSPLRYINACNTPTLIIHSYKDYRCPLEQAYQLFTALKDREIDTELYVFHDETHELSRSGKPKARRKRLQAITEWMDKYLTSVDISDQPVSPEPN